MGLSIGTRTTTQLSKHQRCDAPCMISPKIPFFRARFNWPPMWSDLRAVMIAGLLPVITMPASAAAECPPSAHAVWSTHPGSHASRHHIAGRKCWLAGQRSATGQPQGSDALGKRACRACAGSSLRDAVRANRRGCAVAARARGTDDGDQGRVLLHTVDAELAPAIMTNLELDFARACLMQCGLKRSKRVSHIVYRSPSG
jgi:hypothetical protein